MAQQAQGDGKPDAEDLNARIGALQKDISAITDILGQMARNRGEAAADAVQDRLSELRERGSAQADMLQARAYEVGERTGDFVHRQPVTALGMAAGLGFLAGMIAARR